LHRLYTGTGLRRRLHIGEWHGTSTGSAVVESQSYLFVACKRDRATSVNRWGVVRWLPNVTPGYNPNDLDLHKQARKLVLGMTSEATMRGIWDIIPWTWMIDWFVNVHDFTMQYSNTVPATSQAASIMTTSETTEVWTPTSVSTGYTGGGGLKSIVTKERYVGPGSLSAHIPFLNGSRLSILGSLFIQRFLR
jgi:hypothetical protein